MIEQQHQQHQQIINSIMIANCNKYFGHHNPQPHIPSSSSASLTPIAAATVTKSSLVKIMSNPGVSSGASNSVGDNNKIAAAPAPNGMSSPSVVVVNNTNCGSVGDPSSPQQAGNPAISNKLGSRRIFSPHFKIQVLESYRNDSDCKGNQRATARKYGIHRRQIQKWLQCETALRTSVSTGGSPPGERSQINGVKQAVDTNNNQRRVLNGGGSGPKATPAPLSTSSNQPRHSVDAADDTNTLMRPTHTRRISMEFFSAATTTTSLIINGGATGGRKIEAMNEAAAVPIKPEFGFASAASSPRLEMPSAGAMLRHHHHHLQQQHHDLYQIPARGTAEEDVSSHPLLPAVPTSRGPFISTIYGAQSHLTTFSRAFPFDYATALPPSHLHPDISSPIDLSVGNAERRLASDIIRHSPPTQAVEEDARVPCGRLGVNEELSAFSAFTPAVEEGSAGFPAVPIDLSCTRKRKSHGVAQEAAKPPKLFKPYLLDEHEEDEEELKVVDEEEVCSTVSKEDSFLDQDLTGLKVKPSHRLEFPLPVYAAQHHQYYPGSSPLHDALYSGHESLTLYPSPQHYRYECPSSADSSPLHHPSRPASLFDSSISSDGAFVSYPPRGSPVSSVDPSRSTMVFTVQSGW